MKKLILACTLGFAGIGYVQAQADTLLEKHKLIVVEHQENPLASVATFLEGMELTSPVMILTEIAEKAVAFVEARSLFADTPFSEVPEAPPALVYSCLAITGLRRKCGPKPGGNKRLYIAPVEYFQDIEFPVYADAVAGEITGPIPLISTPSAKKFIEIQAAYDTTKWGFASKGKSGNQSFEQNITFDFYGIDKDSVALVARLLNTPCVIIARGNNNTNYFVGSLDVPLEFEINSDSGSKGSDPQKITFTAKNDGFMFPVIPLASTATFAIDPLPALA
ncbi:hypothetical protein P1X15_09925 [Runella sp. MFBS21]|uniref:hypothetical protein n=1 Tax=Runella sp. MFBS21 TaxID=3034018 RepID=UPI0023F679B7|nr:hypothetical protein [Runella sp. MFBS21]MDF7817915.1 hypothetical protein [Runella sp. MFBS21]